MYGHRELDRVVDEIYRAGVGMLGPAEVLSTVAGLLGFRIGAVVSVHHRFSKKLCHVTWGIDRAEYECAEREYGISSPTRTLHGAEMNAGDFGFFDEFISPDDLRRQPFCRDVVSRYGLEAGVKVCLENSPDRALFINLIAPSGEVDRETQATLLQTVAPHWARAHMVYMTLDHAESLRRAYWESTSMTRHSVVIFNNSGEVFLANRAAEAVMAGDGLTLSATGVRATLVAEDQCLQAALRHALETSDNPAGPYSGDDVRITRSGSQRPLYVVIAPILAGYRSLGRKPAAMLVAFDPDLRATVSLDRCCELFGFTRAEAQIAIGIMYGQSIEQLSRDYGRRETTTRNLLKRVFHKAGVNRQHELTFMLLSSPLLFHFPDQVLAARTVNAALEARAEGNTRSFFDASPDRWHRLASGGQSPNTSRIS